MPQVEHSVSASTANELRQDRHVPINPEKLKAASEGLKQSRLSSLSRSLLFPSLWENLYYLVHTAVVSPLLILSCFLTEKDWGKASLHEAKYFSQNNPACTRQLS